MKKHVSKWSIALMLAGSLIVACQDESKPEESKEVAKEQNEKKFDADSSQEKSAFAVEAASGNLAEIKLAQLAIQKSSNKEIKDIATMLEADHTAALGDLKSIASVKGITLPTDEPDKTKELITDLSDDKPADFDKNWVKALMDKHEKTISDYEKALNDLKDEDLKAWITKVLPSIRSHHDKLMAINSKLKK